VAAGGGIQSFVCPYLNQRTNGASAGSVRKKRR
jgi:hypothetical protein